MKQIDLVGQRFGKLVVIKETDNKDKGGHYEWICLCDCGNEKAISSNSLRSGTKSCGCLAKFSAGVSALNGLFYRYKTGAERRGLEFSITFDLFTHLLSLPCHYCGDLPAKYYKPTTSNGGIFYNGIDRIDNSLGYVEGNLITACAVCNKAKNTMSYDAFLTMVRKINARIM